MKTLTFVLAGAGIAGLALAAYHLATGKPAPWSSKTDPDTVVYTPAVTGPAVAVDPAADPGTVAYAGGMPILVAGSGSATTPNGVATSNPSPNSGEWLAY